MGRGSQTPAALLQHRIGDTWPIVRHGPLGCAAIAADYAPLQLYDMKVGW